MGVSIKRRVTARGISVYSGTISDSVTRFHQKLQQIASKMPIEVKNAVIEPREEDDQVWPMASYCQKWSDMGRYHSFNIKGRAASKCIVGDKEVVNMAGAHMLNFHDDPKFLSLHCENVRKYGFCSGSSRMLQGIHQPNKDLESYLSKTFDKEYTIGFATGGYANMGFVNVMTAYIPMPDLALDNRDVVFIVDRDMHWTMRDSLLAKRKYKETLFFFNHNDTVDLERLLKEVLQKTKKIIVAIESVYSGDGTVAPITEIVNLCEKYGALSFVEHANAFLIYGKPNRPHYDQLKDLNKITFVMVSFGKAVSGIGGAISGPAKYLKAFESLAGTCMYTSNIPPSTAATVRSILQYADENPQIVDEYLDKCALFRHMLFQAGFYLNETNSCILSIYVGKDEVAVDIRRRLIPMGYLIGVFVYPAQKKDRASIRIYINNKRTVEEFEGFVRALIDLRAELQQIYPQVFEPNRGLPWVSQVKAMM